MQHAFEVGFGLGQEIFYLRYSFISPSAYALGSYFLEWPAGW